MSESPPRSGPVVPYSLNYCVSVRASVLCRLGELRRVVLLALRFEFVQCLPSALCAPCVSIFALAPAPAPARVTMATDMPDLSHLTPEEREIIQSVMMRQKQEEERENEIMRYVTPSIHNSSPYPAGDRYSSSQILASLPQGEPTFPYGDTEKKVTGCIDMSSVPGS